MGLLRQLRNRLQQRRLDVGYFVKVRGLPKREAKRRATRARRYERSLRRGRRR